MRLSSLQKFILILAWENKQGKIDRRQCAKFYDKQKNVPDKKLQANIITKSIERLIDKGLLVGFGEKTQTKLFIHKIKLTNQGKKTAQKILGRQTELPFKK